MYKRVENTKSHIKYLKAIHEVFLKEIALFQEAITIEKAKGSAILTANAKTVKELSEKSDRLLVSMIGVEKERLEMIDNLMDLYKKKLGFDDITITNFIKVLEAMKLENAIDKESEKEFQNTIEDLVKALELFRNRVEELKAEVEANQRLLLHTRRIVQKIIEDDIKKQDKLYDKKKKQTTTVLLNQSI